MKTSKIAKRRGMYLMHDQIGKSFGYDSMDYVGKESFINHIHITGVGRHDKSVKIINQWIGQFTCNWPKITFRIYRNYSRNEITLRFHAVRNGIANWSDDNNGLIIVNGVA